MSRKEGNPKHGMSLTPTYNSYNNMKQRCLNINNPSYKDYGGRGIRITGRWLGKDGFNNFFADMGIAPRGTTLDRVDVNGNYEQSNCRWSTRAEQAVNKRHHSPLGIGVRPAYKGFMVRRFGRYVGYYRTLDEAVKASELAGRREK